MNSRRRIPPSSDRDDRLDAIADEERDAVADFVAEILPHDARVSVYLFQPIHVRGLRDASPGALFDVGPLPQNLRGEHGPLYQCAEAGRTGSFLQSSEDCTRRVPQTTLIDRSAYDSYREYNHDETVRRAQIEVEAARHGFEPQTEDGPPMGWHIHHLALAPSVHTFHALHTGRIPVLGTVFTVTEDPQPATRHEYSNLVDYAIFIAEEALEIRAAHLLGAAHLGANYAGSALESVLHDPSCDDAMQFVIKLLFAHHWFFPYDPVAHALLVRAMGGMEAAADLYARHGWRPPRHCGESERHDATLRGLVSSDLITLIRHLSWYRLGKEFRPRTEQLNEAVSQAVNTAVVLLCGEPASVPAPRHALNARRARDRFLAMPAALADFDRHDRLLSPVFPIDGIRQLVRGEKLRTRVSRSSKRVPLERFEQSFQVCGPGFSEGHTRTHLKPSAFVESFERGGAPRFSAQRESGLHERTKWLCSYAIARLAESAMNSSESAAETA
jgi:hypothetical protein